VSQPDLRTTGGVGCQRGPPHWRGKRKSPVPSHGTHATMGAPKRSGHGSQPLPPQVRHLAMRTSPDDCRWEDKESMLRGKSGLPGWTQVFEAVRSEIGSETRDRVKHHPMVLVALAGEHLAAVRAHIERLGQALVQPRVLRRGEQHEVVEPVVVPIAVAMVDVLGDVQAAAQVVLHEHAMEEPAHREPPQPVIGVEARGAVDGQPPNCNPGVELQQGAERGEAGGVNRRYRPAPSMRPCGSRRFRAV
jgi:hypothetical protein